MFPRSLARGTSLVLALCLIGGCATTGTNNQGTKAPEQHPGIVSWPIPPILVDALSYPYRRPSPLDCPTLAAQVQALDAVLGPDLDNPERSPGTDHAATTLLISGVTSTIPYYGWLRRLTGADRRRRAAEAAIAAGQLRRGYLKGVGEQLGCPPPAAPAAPATSSAPPMAP